jgi:hypothetical protein
MPMVGEDIEYNNLNMRTELDHAYTVEIPGPVLRDIKGKVARLDHIMKWTKRNNASVSEYYHVQTKRHYALLEDNPMYRDAYKEFMAIRALLGEQPSLF